MADALGNQAKGGHWNSGVTLLRNNDLVETGGRAMRAEVLE